MQDTNDTPDTSVREGTTAHGDRAVVARRVDPGQAPDTTEIRRLARAGGYEVVAALEQRRPADAATNLGAGKVEELAARVAETDADAVVVDNELTPAQTYELGDRLPAGTDVLDRYRLVLQVFADGAASRRAKLQVEHARLRYEVPRLREAVGQELEGERYVKEFRDEEPKPIEDLKRRIDDLDRTLKEAADAAAQHRRQRRKQGFDLVALAGYTNAGKSTLLRRLADDLEGPGADDPVGSGTGAADLEGSSATGDDRDRDPSSTAADPTTASDHPDVDRTVTVADRLFETLETTTRRATLGDRRVLVTDTVGFVQHLPHELVQSFSPTLDEVGAADVAVAVADASAPPERLRERLATTMDVLDRADPRATVVALNKVDRVDADELTERRAAVADLAPDPVATSATGGAGLEALADRIRAALPTERADLELPPGDEAMALVSELHDTATVLEVEYGDRIRVALEGRPAVLERARGRAAALDGATDEGCT